MGASTMRALDTTLAVLAAETESNTTIAELKGVPSSMTSDSIPPQNVKKSIKFCCVALRLKLVMSTLRSIVDVI